MKQAKSYLKQAALIGLVILPAIVVIGCGGSSGSNTSDQSGEHQHDHEHSDGADHSH